MHQTQSVSFLAIALFLITSTVSPQAIAESQPPESLSRDFASELGQIIREHAFALATVSVMHAGTLLLSYQQHLLASGSTLVLPKAQGPAGPRGNIPPAFLGGSGALYTGLKARFYGRSFSPQKSRANLREMVEIRNPGDLTSIYLCGEDHYCAQDRATKEELKQRASQREFVLALEGNLFTGQDTVDEPNVFGIEDAFAHQLTMSATLFVFLIRGHLNLYGESERSQENKANFLLALLLDHFSIQVLERIQINELSDSAAALFRLVKNQLVNGKLNRDRAVETARKITRMPIWKDGEAFALLARAFALAFANLAETPEIRARYDVPNLSPFYSVVRNPQDLVAEFVFANEIGVKWRDQTIAAYIRRIHVIAQRMGLPLVVCVGKLHLWDLSQKLKD